MKNIIDLLGKNSKIHTYREWKILWRTRTDHRDCIKSKWWTSDFNQQQWFLYSEKPTWIWDRLKALLHKSYMSFRQYTRTFAKSAGVVVETPPSLHLASFYLCRYVASLISTVLNRMGAVIRKKSVLAAYCVRSLVDTRSVLTGDLSGKKKARIHKGYWFLLGRP